MTLVFCAGIATHILTNALISIGILRISTSSLLVWVARASSYLQLLIVAVAAAAYLAALCRECG